MQGGITMIAIKTTDIAQNFMNVFNRIIQGEKFLISSPQNEKVVIITEREYNQLMKMTEKTKMSIRASILDDVKALQQNAINSGAPKMTMAEIDEEVQAYRREKRGL